MNNIRGDHTNYVAGALFDVKRNNLAIIEKLKPAWQFKKFNLIGGMIEDNETPLEAMRREFFEEAGLKIDDWTEFCILTLKGGNRIHFFKAFNVIQGIYNKTDEKIYLINPKFIDNYPIIPNLKWLVPMALDKDNVTAQVLDLS